MALLRSEWLHIHSEGLQAKVENEENLADQNSHLERVDHNLIGRLEHNRPERLEHSGMAVEHNHMAVGMMERNHTGRFDYNARVDQCHPDQSHVGQADPSLTSQTPTPQPGRRKRASSTRERTCKIPAPAAGKRSSIYRGVTRHRWTGRYEAHLWDKGTWNHTQNKKGKQVYLGAYDDEEAAARAYDLAALKYWGPGTLINFPVTDYTKDIEEMQNVTREEYLASLRRKSSGFSRGVSKYRGVARHHHNGRWEARIGRVFGNKYLYLGTYSTQEEAAAAYDMAAIEYRGLNAVTNFDLSRYIRWLRPNNTNGVPPAPEDVNPKEKEEHPLYKFQGMPRLEETPKQVWPSHNSGHSSVPYQQQQLPSLGLSCDNNNNNNHNQTQKKAASPTALGLLLQSSMFRQMLEKTSARHSDELSIDVGGHYLAGGGGQFPDELHSRNEDSDAGYTSFHQHQPETFTFLQSPRDPSPQQQDGEGGNVDQGLSLWTSFGSSLSTLPLTNAIGC